MSKLPLQVTVKARGATTEIQWAICASIKRWAKNVVLFLVMEWRFPSWQLPDLCLKAWFTKKPYFGLQNPSGFDSIITENANSATSMNTGQTSSINTLSAYADSEDDDFKHPKRENYCRTHQENVWRRAEKPAITDQALNGCQDSAVAVQPEVLMGSGGKYSVAENRDDYVNMYEYCSAAGYTVTRTRADTLVAAKDVKTEKLLPVSHLGNMELWLDKNVCIANLNDTENSPTGDGVAPTDQPILDEMVMSAIEILSRNENGFDRMIGAASTDKSAHPLDAPRTLSNLIEFDNTLGKVMEWAKAKVKANGDDTLFDTTAVYEHCFDVFGSVDTKIWDDAANASEKEPASNVEHMCAAVSDNAGRMFGIEMEETTQMNCWLPDYEDKDGDFFPDTWDDRTVLGAGMNNYPDHTEDFKVSTSSKKPAAKTSAGYLNNPEDDPNDIFLTDNPGLKGSTSVHSLQDVGFLGYGAGAGKIGGIKDDTEIFHIIASALEFGTNGTMHTDMHLCDDVVKCKNMGNMLHCDEVSCKYMCSCRQNGPEAFVRPTTKMYSVKEGVAMLV